MKRTFRVPLPYNPARTPIFADGITDAEILSLPVEMRDIEIDEVPQADRVARVIMEWRQERYDPPGFVLLGWETWLQLGWEMQRLGYGGGIRLTEFLGVPIAVLEDKRDHCQALPQVNAQVRLGGGK